MAAAPASPGAAPGPAAQLEIAALQRQLGAIQPGVGEHLLDEGVQRAEIPFQPLLLLGGGRLGQHGEPVAQPHQGVRSSCAMASVSCLRLASMACNCSVI